MNKIEEKALQEYPVIMETLIPAHDDMPEIHQDVNVWCRDVYVKSYKQALADVREEIESRRKLPHGWDSEGEPQYWEEIGIDEGYKYILNFIDNLTK